MASNNAIVPQIASYNNLAESVAASDTLDRWAELFFQVEVTTAERSQQAQHRDIERFLAFMEMETGSLVRTGWTPRLSAAYVRALQNEIREDARRRWSNTSINRFIAHLKTFAKWIHLNVPFPLGQPMAKIHALRTTNVLQVERAFSKQERRRLLDAADMLVLTGGKSKDRTRYKDVASRPTRKAYRPYRNRAIVYALIETGMRRGAVRMIDLKGVDASNLTLDTIEKGSAEETYQISREGMQAILDYIEYERSYDADGNDSPALFLAARSRSNATQRLSVRTINTLWNQIAEAAGVEGKTPHTARHAMGRHVIEKTGNATAVARQLKHKNLSYSLKYARVTKEEMQNTLDERD